MTTIYVLLDNNQIRYIGKTTKADLKDKLEQHHLDAMVDPEKLGWITDLFRNGKRPEIKPIVTYNDEDAEHYEKIFFNDFKFFLGIRLTNSETIKIQRLFQSKESKNVV